MAVELATPVMEFCGLDGGCWAYFFYNWQSLLGGAAAVGAAVYAGRYVQKQIDASDRIERDRLTRRERAAKAVFPLTLTRFNDYAEACAEVLRKLVAGTPSRPGVFSVPSPIVAPQLPPDAIGELERMIEASTSQVATTVMSRLAAHTQVLHSVFSDMAAEEAAHGAGSYRVEPNLPAYEIRVARVHAAASCLYAWARGEVDEPGEVSWTSIEEALSILNIGNARTMEMLARAREQGKDPLGW